MLTGKNYIGNKLSGEGNIFFKTFNPLLNEENNQVFVEASTKEIDEAVMLSAQAFKQYRNISGKDKAAFLNAIADEILALDDKLIQTYCSETGLPEARAIGERGRTIFQLRSFADLVAEGSWVDASIDTENPDRLPLPKPDLRKMTIPLGPVVVFGASNFPLAYSTAGGDTASALAAGCPVIVKSHPMHAGTGELVASAIIKAVQKTGMPNGVFSNLNSSGIDVGIQLVKHSEVKAIGFTGSIRGGRALFDLAAQKREPIPVFAEMGSINPVVLLPQALKENKNLPKLYADSITLGTGQFCTNPGLLLGVKSDELTEFVKRLGEEIVQIEPSVMLHPNIAKAYHENENNAVAQSDVNVVANYVNNVKSNFAKQVVATTSGKTFLKNPVLHQEVFGPYSLVVACEDVEELEAIISNLEGQLTGTIMAAEKEVNEYINIVEALQNRVGRIIYNGVPTGVEVCPSMVHGGPYPASTDSRFTAVGIHAVKRWVRPFSYQNWPNELLPDELKDENPIQIIREVNGKKTTNEIK